MRTQRTLSAALAAAAGLALSATAGAQLAIVNTEPGTFIDISTTGTAIAGTGDDTAHQFTSTVGNILFPAGTVSVCTNGFMSAGNSTGTAYANVAIPATGLPVGGGGTAWTPGTQGYLLPWWDDLYAALNPNTTIYYQEISGVLIVQWNSIYHFGYTAAGETVTFQVKVFGTPVNNVYIQYIYNDSVFGGAAGAAGLDNAANATIGYVADANSNGSNTQWSLNTASISSGTVLSIKPGVTGACCLPAGNCTNGVSPNNCSAQGGVYQGDNSNCSTITCPLPGACCLPDGTCSVLSVGACAAQGGTFAGSSTNCTTGCPNAFVCTSITGQSVPILDTTAGGTAGPEADLPLNVTTNATITSMSARIRVSHTWQGDVRVRLVHPDSTSVDLIARPGVPAPKYSNPVVGFSADNFGGPGPTDWMTFVDTAPGGVYDDANGFPGPPAGTVVAPGVTNPTGVWRAEDGAGPSVASLNTVFAGKPTAGTWHLMASDYAVLDVGTINGLMLCFAPDTTPAGCYPNCDGSTIQPCLNVQDFGCFLNQFANGTTYANCDNSTIAPVLNVQDFGCFLNKFAEGCSSC